MKQDRVPGLTKFFRNFDFRLNYRGTGLNTGFLIPRGEEQREARVRLSPLKKSN
jgi:hypothetical protein